MEYIIDDKKVIICPQDLKQISSGYEGITYEYCGKVLKLYYNIPKKTVLSLHDCEYMTNLNTKRILLPEKIVADKQNNMCGYIISPYIEDDINVCDINGDMLLQERSLIQKELIYLGEKYISVDDFCLDNFMISDKFYLIDPGSYKVHRDMMNDDERNIIYLANRNLEYFDSFLYNEIFLRFAKKYINNKELYKEFTNEFYRSYMETGYDSRMEYLEKCIQPDISLNDNIKQIVKTHRN